MTPAAKRPARNQKATGDTENPTASIPGENMPEAPATRAAGLIPGAEYDTSSGPQEVGATRGARRPVTERLRGDRGPVRAGAIPRNARSEEEQAALDEQAERREAWLEAQKKGKLTNVIATRTGYYGGKRRRRGAMFGMAIPKGEDLPTWVVEAPSKDRADVEMEDVTDSIEERNDDVLG